MPDIDNVLPPMTLKVTDELTDSFGYLDKTDPPVEKPVVVMLEHQAITLMEVEHLTEVLKDANVSVKKPLILNVTISDNINLINNFQLDTRSAKDLLQYKDVHKYKGDEKFNPKSFESGSSVGYIDLSSS